MLKRTLSLLLALALLCCSLPVFAEETDEPDENDLTGEELQALLEEEAPIDDDDEEPEPVKGPTWHEMDLNEVTKDTPVIYTCRIILTGHSDYTSIYSQRIAQKEYTVLSVNKSTKADVLSVGLVWCIVRCKGKLGYVKRAKIDQVVPVDKVNTPPYGVLKSTYVCTTAAECHVRKSMSDEDDCYVVLNPGTQLSLWKIVDGWGIVIYWRNYGYIRMDELTDLVPVSPTDKALNAETPIAAYTSFYKMEQSEKNINRIWNIRLGCQLMSCTLQPGESFNFNKRVGPYNKRTGYKIAGVLSDGGSASGYGGGTCQVSSTLYNALKQLPGVTILHRRPHGEGGASYLPHGMDAAVGNSQLNLKFRNDYSFPIRIEGHTSDDGALLMLVYRADLTEGEALTASAD